MFPFASTGSRVFALVLAVRLDPCQALKVLTIRYPLDVINCQSLVILINVTSRKQFDYIKKHYIWNSRYLHFKKEVYQKEFQSILFLKKKHHSLKGCTFIYNLLSFHEFKVINNRLSHEQPLSIAT